MSGVKTRGLPAKVHLKLTGLRSAEVRRILGVAVTCADIKEKTGGEGALLGTF